MKITCGNFTLSFVDQDEEQLVTVEAYHTLSVMAECSGDFIRQRFVTDVLSRMVSTLDQQVQCDI